MKKINNIYIGALLALGLVSCSNEAPFKDGNSEGTGRLLTSSLTMKVKTDTPTVRAVETDNYVPTPNDFSVKFYKVGDESNAVKTFSSYGEMPEIVELAEGDYIVKVSYGGDYGNSITTAAFNAPHYTGESEEFTIVKDKIVDTIKPIVCTLNNVRVAVNFDMSLSSVMSDDSKVTVKVGEVGTSLDFRRNTTQDGYFAFAEGSTTLAATFSGTVQGVQLVETRTFNNVERGNYYQITFKLKYADSADPGNIETGDNGFSINASVAYKDLSDDENHNDATPDDNQDVYLEDDMRPENGEAPESPKDPGTDPTPDIPDDPSVEDAFSVTVNPEGSIQLGKDGINYYENISECTLDVKCPSGITKFLIKVHSENKPELDNAINDVFGGEIDLVNRPSNGYWEEILIGLGVQVDLGGKTEVSFVLSNFFPFVAELFDDQTTEFTIEIAGKSSEEKDTIIMNVKFPENPQEEEL